MALPENEAAVAAIVEEFTPRVIGQTLPGFSCCCGAVKGATATVVEIRPAGGDQYPGQETCWVVWTVKLQPNPGEPNNGWSTGLSQFIPVEEIKEIFRRHFGDRVDQ